MDAASEVRAQPRKGSGIMSEHLYTFAVLDKQIQDGFNHFQESYSVLGNSIRQAYTQGFLDGIRSNLDNLAEAYKRDLRKEVEG